MRHTTSCFMSSHHPEVTAGLTSPSQPFNYCTIYALYILQMIESIISAAFYWHGIKGGLDEFGIFTHKHHDRMLYDKFVMDTLSVELKR